MEFLIAPFKLFIAIPLLAFVPALVFAIAWFAHKPRISRFVIIMAALWTLYALWESLLWWQARSNPDQTADIRVDLLLIAPILLIGTPLALFFWVRSLRNAKTPA